MRYTFGDRVYDFGSRTYVMGILNITPDSFSDGGKYFGESADLKKAVEDALIMEKCGADFIDIGGESTRPGAERVSEETEMERVIPVISEVSRKVSIPVSVDTYKSRVAEESLKAGARIVNDISGFRFDPAIAEVTARSGASCILMHIKGTPGNMQVNPVYEDVTAEVISYLRDSAEIAGKAGVRQIILDPGIGFGKTLEHNIELIRSIGELRKLGYPVLIGLSRKSFIDKIAPAAVTDRLNGTISANTAAVRYGADVVRVHDVCENVPAMRVADKIIRN